MTTRLAFATVLAVGLAPAVQAQARLEPTHQADSLYESGRLGMARDR